MLHNVNLETVWFSRESSVFHWLHRRFLFSCSALPLILYIILGLIIGMFFPSYDGCGLKCFQFSVGDSVLLLLDVFYFLALETKYTIRAHFNEYIHIHFYMFLSVLFLLEGFSFRLYSADSLKAQNKQQQQQKPEIQMKWNEKNFLKSVHIFALVDSF